MTDTNEDLYQDICQRFSWAGVDEELGWPAQGPVSLAQAIIDRHAHKTQDALIYLDQDGQTHRYSYADLSRYSSQFADALKSLGVQPGDRVAGLMPRGVEVLITILASFKCGAIYVPIFTGFGQDALAYRLKNSDSRHLVTHQAYRDTLADTSSLTIVCVHENPAPVKEGDLDFWSVLNGGNAHFDAVKRPRNDRAALIYTSGSTGQPKGGVLAVNLLASTWPYVRHGADMQASDVIWPTGDPGWGYGFVCYLGALAMGSTVLSVRHNPKPEEFLDIMSQHGVTNLATTPTLLRAVMALGETVVGRRLSRVRAISSCGEPLNGEVVNFFRKVWKCTPMDHFGATEYGLPIGNFNSFPMTVKPGSMGLPFPGTEIAVLDEKGNELPDDTVGLLAKKNSREALYWLEYWNNPDADRELLRAGWIVTGDLVRRDVDGYYWFEGRASDMIKSAGYRIGPFEVESALLKHPAVAEAAVIGKPDAQRGQIVKAYVTLVAGHTGCEALAEELKQLVRTTAGRHLYPREIEFVTALPKTETGKIQRFLLRDQES